ncbi:MAG: hypothetical protein MI725_02180 [Pirellulales bacterium]|nr:hypothetical protein [Pirellulales bacterium]
MAKKKHARRTDASGGPAPSPRRQNKTLRRLFLLLILLLGLVAAAPTIVSQTPLRNYLLGMALPAPGSGWGIEAQSASLSWSGNQTMTGLSIVDPTGQPFLMVESITWDRSLLAIAAKWTDLGKVRLQKPTAYLVIRPDGSNAEDLLSEMLQEEGESSSTQLSLQVEVAGGTLHGLDTATRHGWSLTEANLIANLGGDVTGSANLVTTQNGAQGHLKFRLQPIEAGGQQLDLLAEQLPLQILQPWLARALPGAQLSGTVTIDAPQIRWMSDPERGLFVQTAGRLEGKQLAFTADALEGDRLICRQLSTPWQLSLADNKISIQQLAADAGWAKLRAQGSMALDELAALSLGKLPTNEMTVAGNVALGRLAAMLPRTLRLHEGVRIDSGQLEFQADGKPGAKGFGWTAQASVEDVAGSNRGQPIRWQEPIKAKVEFVDTPQGPQMEQLALSAPFAEAQFETRRDEISGAFQVDLEEFSRELGQFIDLSAWQLRGRGKGRLTLAREAGQQFPADADLEGTVTGLQVKSDSVSIDEPRVQFTGKLRWDAKTSSFASPEFLFVGNTLAFRARDLAVRRAANGAISATGGVALRADLERLSAAVGFHSGQDAVWPHGTAEAQLQVASRNGQVQTDFSTIVEQLQLLRNRPTASHSEILWNEPQLQLSGKAVYEIAADRVRLENVQLRGKTLQVSGLARVDQLRTAQLLEASGQLQYDARELARLLATYLGPDVQLQGDRQLRFQVAGRLSEANSGGKPLDWSQRWQVSADAGWSAASLYGLAVGPGKLQGTLQNGQIQVAPLNVAVGQGKLTARPQVSLTPGAQQVFLPRGPLLTKVNVSPEVSQTMLKYVAPVVAGATRTEGEFSINLGDSQVPLAHPEQARIVGQVSVHRLRVAPGPMMQEMETVIRQLKALSDGKQFLTAAASRKSTALTIADRHIDFQVVEGRVYHRNLEFEIDGVPITSHGSVGFDQTLALVFEIPLQEKWLGNSLRSLAGQTLQIPLRGTFQKPELDSRAVADLSSRFLQNAAGSLLEDEVNRQLEKLFRGR